MIQALTNLLNANVVMLKYLLYDNHIELSSLHKV